MSNTTPLLRRSARRAVVPPSRFAHARGRFPAAARGLVRGAAAGRVCRGCGGGAGGRDGPRAARLDRTAMRRMPLAGRCRCAGGRPPSAGLAATVDAAIGFEYCMRILNEQQVGVPIRRETESDLYVLAPTNPARDRRDGKYDTRSNPNITLRLPAYLKRHRAARVILAHTWRLHRSPGRAARRTGGARRAVERCAGRVGV